MEGQGRAVEEATLRLILLATPCPADVVRRATRSSRGFAARRSQSRRGSGWLARAQEEEYWRRGGKEPLRRAIDSYHVVADDKGDLAAEAPLASNSRRNVKGTLVIARMKYLRARGPDDAERVLKRMSAADQAVLRGILLPSSWYAAHLLLRFEMTIAAILARGDRRDLFLDMGRFTADTNLGPNGVQRSYLREGDPHFLLRNAPRMYAAQHAGGVRTYEQMGPRGAVIRTTEGEEPDGEDCLTAVGWLRRAIELSGGQFVTVEETRCRARGGDCCEFICRWA